MYDQAMSLMGRMKTDRAGVALHFFEQYVNGAIIQWERIQKVKKEFLAPATRVNPFLVQTLFMDIHFYFICHDKVQNLFEKIASMEGDQELTRLWEKSKPIFRPYNNVRNHLEHIDERINNKSLSDFGNLRNDIYTFGPEQVDIGPLNLKILTEAYEKVIDHLNSRLKT
jgi:hypothetical protein